MTSGDGSNNFLSINASYAGCPDFFCMGDGCASAAAVRPFGKKKPAEQRCSAGSFFVTIETFLTLSPERPVLPVQAREPEPGPGPWSEPVSALRLSCTLRLQRITPRQKAGK